LKKINRTAANGVLKTVYKRGGDKTGWASSCFAAVPFRYSMIKKGFCEAAGERQRVFLKMQEKIL